MFESWGNLLNSFKTWSAIWETLRTDDLCNFSVVARRVKTAGGKKGRGGREKKKKLSITFEHAGFEYFSLNAIRMEFFDRARRLAKFFFPREINSYFYKLPSTFPLINVIKIVIFSDNIDSSCIKFLGKEFYPPSN